MKTTIHTLKKEYKDNQTYLNEKQKLFQNLTYHMIEKELNHNDIDIQYTAVMDYYKQCEDIDETIAFFDEKYDQQLDRGRAALWAMVFLILPRRLFLSRYCTDGASNCRSNSASRSSLGKQARAVMTLKLQRSLVLLA